MTYCANCGTALADDVIFCPNCGTQAEKNEIIVNEAVVPTNKADLTQAIPETPQPVPIPPTPVSSDNNRKQFCRNCGNEVGPGAFACTNCGLPPMKAFNFCPSCGNNCHQDAVLCIKCGVQLESKDAASTLSGKSIDTSKAYCRNCGKEVRKGATACLNCGLNPAKSRNFCPSCGSDTHNEAVICIKCGTGLVQSQPQAHATAPPPPVQNYSASPPNRPNVVIVGKQKSTGTAFILAFLFGPFGLLYASVTGGIIMIFVGILLFFMIPIIGGLISWIICMIWAVIAAGEANRSAIANANRMANNR